MMAVTDEHDRYTVTGLTPVPNDHIASYVREYPDIFLGFGVDRSRGRESSPCTKSSA